MAEYKYVTYETLDDGVIARIMLSREQSRNAQNRGLLVELDDAFLRAEADDTGPRRHPRRRRPDLLVRPRPRLEGSDRRAHPAAPTQHPTFSINGGTRKGAENRMLQEWHYFFENTKRWRNLRKITIAQVNGTVYAAGLMLMWACDLIVAADDARFADVVGTRLGMCGVEYFAHPWEFGPRKTKELMLTGDALDVDEAHRLGMVSKVFPTDELARAHARVRPPYRGSAHDDRAAHQGVGEPERRQHGVPERARGVLHDPPAQPRALGRGPREPDAGGAP